jgi:hypothetical protein
MKGYLHLLLAIVFTSCGMNSSQGKYTEDSVKRDSSAVVFPASHLAAQQPDSMQDAVDSTDYDHATYYVVVADTSLNYYDLHRKMFSLSEQLALSIDTLGRTFDSFKNLIALPEDDEDELFAGDYHPRRFPSTTLSLEYLILYEPTAGEKTIALVTGIFENEARADSALLMLKRVESKSFKIKADMYIGCIH